MFARTILSDNNPIGTDADADASSPAATSTSPSKWASYGRTVDPRDLQPQAKKRKVSEEIDEIDQSSEDDLQIG